MLIGGLLKYNSGLVLYPGNILFETLSLSEFDFRSNIKFNTERKHNREAKSLPRFIIGALNWVN